MTRDEINAAVTDCVRTALATQHPGCSVLETIKRLQSEGATLHEIELVGRATTRILVSLYFGDDRGAITTADSRSDLDRREAGGTHPKENPHAIRNPNELAKSAPGTELPGTLPQPNWGKLSSASPGNPANSPENTRNMFFRDSP
jgi:hypothetical protein